MCQRIRIEKCQDVSYKKGCLTYQNQLGKFTSHLDDMDSNVELLRPKQPVKYLQHFPYWCLVWRCILGLAPAYFRDLCCPTPGTRGRSSLRSSEQGLLFVPFARTVTTQARAFSVVGPLCGMGFLCRNDCSPGFCLTHSTLVSKLFFLAVQGSGALLSSNLEGALYKSP